MIHRFRFALALTCVGVLTPIAFAADKPEPKAAAAPKSPKIVITDRKLVDEDYPFMGEYVGSVTPGMNAAQEMSLQVYPTGDGKFQGVLHVGSLPGLGWASGAKYYLSGKRNGDRVTLETRPYVVEIDLGMRATVRYQNSSFVTGELRKITRTSPTLGLHAPCNAVTLFGCDGQYQKHWKNPKLSPSGNLMAGTETLCAYRDFTMHLEFRTPYMPNSSGQGRGNSGVYIQGRYEVQILDSFGMKGEFNECGSLYRQKSPDVNMALPPLTWQTYDITFRAARFDEDGQKVSNARITVVHNGVVIHNDVEIPNKTGAGRKEGPEVFPIKLQDHGDPVEFRNIWIIDCCDPCLDDCCQQPFCRKSN